MYEVHDARQVLMQARINEYHAALLFVEAEEENVLKALDTWISSMNQLKYLANRYKELCKFYGIHLP